MADHSTAYGGRSQGGYGCPHCQGAVVRVRRRVFDRLISVVSPRQRFRCVAFGCGWEGALRVKRPQQQREPRSA
jgi:hypothetical protein